MTSSTGAIYQDTSPTGDIYQDDSSIGAFYPSWHRQRVLSTNMTLPTGAIFPDDFVDWCYQDDFASKFYLAI